MTTNLTVLAAAVLATGTGLGAGAAARPPAHSAAAHSAPAGITRYLVQPSELPGVTFDRAEVKNTLKAWLAGEPASERKEDAAAYRAEGFRRAAFENFSGPNDAQGVSNVVVFAHRAGARQDQRTLLHPIGASKPFSVSGIPGAKGFSQAGKHSSAADVIWVQGRCTLIVGNYSPHVHIRHAPLITAAKAVYHRTHGTCPK